ncbi:hypothetical protein Hanom_Chr03g00218241 [Helianthus anomalus]
MIPSSPSKVVDAEALKKGGEDPSIKVLSSEGTPPAVHVEQVLKETGADTILDTLDSSKNFIDPRGEGDKGARSQNPLFMRRYPVLLPQARELKSNLQFSRMSLNWIIIFAFIPKCIDCPPSPWVFCVTPRKIESNYVNTRIQNPKRVKR